jgi:gamma-glutamylcyclotransferase (GGCT)/AIG2-like uncharacterized protein YtfP
MSNEVAGVFVYGTLKRGQVRESCWPLAPLSIRPCYVRGALFDLGPYPALTEGEDWIVGELWSFLAPQLATTLAALDRIEGYQVGRTDNLYERCVLSTYAEPVAAAIADARAYVYRMALEQLPASSIRLPGPIAFWPPQNRPPEQTSRLPDPFPEFT